MYILYLRAAKKMICPKKLPSSKTTCKYQLVEFHSTSVQKLFF